MSIDIAVIDSGLDAKHDTLWKNIALTCSIDESGIRHDNADDLNGHGTACSDILLRYCPVARLSIYKIFSNEMVTHPTLLIKALRECEKSKFHLINISMGLIAKDQYAELLSVCRRLYDAGTILVASACEDDQYLSWPADFDFVIKVSNSQAVSQNGFGMIDKRSHWVYTYGGREIAAWKNGRQMYVEGNSFACARMTGILAHTMLNSNKDPIKFGLGNYLELHATLDTRKCYSVTQKVELSPAELLCGKRVSFFPFNKEMHSLLRFRSKVGYSIVTVGDFSFSRQIDMDAGECIGLPNQGLKIKSGYHSLFEEDFQVVILGDVSEASRIYKRSLVMEYCKRAFELGKDVVSIELLQRQEYEELKEAAQKAGRVFMSLNSMIDILRSEKIPDILFRAPTLCVLSTGPKTGKYALQVNLEETLKRLDYQVGVVSTEPHGFVFGYATVPLGNAHFLEYCPFEAQINYIRHTLIRVNQAEDYDLILIGGQSGVVPYNYATVTNYHSLSSIMVMVASKPDGFILCINPTDELSYIRRTISAIESFGYGKVFMCAMTNQHIEPTSRNNVIYERKTYLDCKDLSDICRVCSEALGIPVLGILQKEQMEQAIIAIQNYFT